MVPDEFSSSEELRDRLDRQVLITPGEVARLFGVSPKTVSRWADAGKLSPIRTRGGHRRYSAMQVRKALERHGLVPAGDQLIEPRRVTRLLGVTNSTLQRWSKSGQLDPVVCPSGQRRYRLLKSCNF